MIVSQEIILRQLLSLFLNLNIYKSLFSKSDLFYLPLYIKKVAFVLFFQLCHASLDRFHSDDVILVESISVNNHNGIQIYNQRHGQAQFKGNQFIRLEISNNSPKGYKIYATSVNGKLKTGHRSVPGAEIQYLMVCDAYKTNVDNGFTVLSSGQIKLNPKVKTLIYDVNQPSNVTDRAKPFCSLFLAPGEHLRDNFAGNYNDNILFEMVTNDR